MFGKLKQKEGTTGSGLAVKTEGVEKPNIIPFNTAPPPANIRFMFVSDIEAFEKYGIPKATFYRLAAKNEWACVKLGDKTKYRVPENAFSNEIEPEIGENKKTLLDELPNWQRAIVENRLFLCTEAVAAGGKLSEFVEMAKLQYGHIIEELPGFSESSLRRWLKLYRENPNNPEKLAPDYGKRKGQHNLTDEQKQLIHALYLHENKLNMATVWDVLGMKGHNVTYNVVRNYCNSIDESVKAKGRLGEKAFKDNYKPYVQRDYDSLTPNEIWVSDGHEMELFCKHPTQERAFSPTLVVWQDIKSRLWTGWQLVENENKEGILAALKHGIEKYGKPEIVFTDNGKGYDNKILSGEKDIAGVFATLGLDITRANPYNAQSKPIERPWVEVKEKFCKLFDSYKGGSSQEKPERLKNVKYDSLPTFEEVESRLKEFIEWRNHKMYEARGGHRGSGCDNRTPMQIFNEELPEAKRVMIDSERLRMLCLYAEERTVLQNGVSFKKNSYYHEKLSDYLSQKVIIKYDPYDIKQLHIYDKQNGGYICTADVKKTAHGLFDIPAIKENNKNKKNLNKHIKEADKYKSKLKESPFIVGMVEEDMEILEDNSKVQLGQKKANTIKPGIEYDPLWEFEE